LDDRLASPVERGIQDNWHASKFVKSLEQCHKKGITVIVNHLNASPAVDMDDRRSALDALLVSLRNRQHEVVLGGGRPEILIEIFGEDHRSEWPEWFAMLDLTVD